MGQVMGLPRQTQANDSSATDKALFLRTSGMEIVQWERQKIVEALMRETYLDEGTAERVGRGGGGGDPAFAHPGAHGSARP